MRLALKRLVLTLIVGVFVSASASAQDTGLVLTHNDNRADGRYSYGGGWEQIIEFSAPQAPVKIIGLSIHGSRYGADLPPIEDFMIYFLTVEYDAHIVATEMAPYSLFEKGPEKWTTVIFRNPIELSDRFRVALDFRAHSTKGVYVSYDTSTGGRYSGVWLPGQQVIDTKFNGDWMIEAVLAE